MADTPTTTTTSVPDQMINSTGTGIAPVMTALSSNPSSDLYAAAFDAANKIVFTPNADGSNSIAILTPSPNGNSTAAVMAPLVPSGVPMAPKKDNTILYLAIAGIALMFFKKGRS